MYVLTLSDKFPRHRTWRLYIEIKTCCMQDYYPCIFTGGLVGIQYRLQYILNRPLVVTGMLTMPSSSILSKLKITPWSDVKRNLEQIMDSFIVYMQILYHNDNFLLLSLSLFIWVLKALSLSLSSFSTSHTQ
jgi:hypothetical protein